MNSNILTQFRFVFRGKMMTFVILFFSSTVFGQLAGVKTIPGSYASIAAAIADLDTSGVAPGGVTFNIAAGYTETITATLSITATGTAANPIIFQKDPDIPGANPVITAYTTGFNTPASNLMDGILRLVGSDYITFDRIDLSDNSTNSSNPATMEYGYGLFKVSATNGCQYNTIKNCVITLNNINNAVGTALMSDGSTGIMAINATFGASTSSITVTSAAGTNSHNKFYGNTIQNTNTGISLMGYAASSPFTLADSYNDVGGNSLLTGNTIINFGGAASAINPAVGVRTLAQYFFNASYNTINNNTGSGTNHPTILRGILTSTATTASETISFNTISINGGGTIESIFAIQNSAGSTASGNTVSITNNTINNCTYSTATAGSMYGIYNTATPAILQINSNTLESNSTASATGFYYPIFNAGSAVTTITIDSNAIGTPSSPAINFTAVNSVLQTFINNTGGGAAAALSISNNNFYNVLYTAQGSGANTYISNIKSTGSQAIIANKFNNLNVNTTGGITFISNNVTVPGNGTQNVNNNSIIGGFTKAAGGIVSLFTSTTANSATGAIINQNNNNFSNITITGATSITGWYNIDAGGSTKTISNNIFSNWLCGTGSVTVMSVNLTSTNTFTTNNKITNITAGGNVTAISSGAGNDKIFSNTIDSIFTTGLNVTGISVTSGTTKYIYNNKLYTLQANNALGVVFGISVTGSTTSGVVTAYVHNNLIGDLRAPSTNSADAIRGINISSSRANTLVNVYFNTIYLNATSTGTNFGTCGIYHSAGISTTGALNLRNNIVANHSTPNGTGATIAFRRSSSVLTNYVSTSNNNLFYAGTPAANRLIYYDGSSDLLLSAYKARVSPRDAQSVTEDLITVPKFLSTSGPSSTFLHLDPSKPTLAESGAINIANFPADYDFQPRQGNAGYAGLGIAPDIGADEFDGIQASGLSGSYNVGTGQVFTSLTNAGGLFASINNLGLTGNVSVNITSDLLEDGSNALNQWAEQGIGTYTLTIGPDASTARIISGSVLTGLIRLNGAKRLTIDGSNGTTNNYLTFRNTSPTGTTGTAFTFINGATNDSIRHCNIEAYANLTNGVILFSTSTVTGGNSNNVISNCTINATVNGLTGTLCIYSGGTAAAGFANSANTISNNIITNYRDRGLDIPATGSTGWVISGNSIYNGDISGSITYAASTILHSVRVLGGSGYSIINNYIGGNASLASGTQAVYTSTAGLLTFVGILLNTSSATPLSNIKSNTIANISVASVPVATGSSISNVFFGIETTGFGINIGGNLAGEGNTIGSNSVNGSILITTTTAAANRSYIRGITCSSSGGLVNGNQVGGIDIKNIGTSAGPSTFWGIYVNNAAAPSQVNNNIIGSNGTGAATNSIRVLSSSTSTATLVTGMLIGASVVSTIQVNGNIIKNISHQSPTASGNVTGLSSTALSPAVVTFNNNTISGNINNATAGTFYGVYSNGSNPSSITITNNIISGNTSTATSGVLYGVYMGSSTPYPTAVIINNNTFSTNTNTASTGAFAGFYNASIATSLSIAGNTINGNYTSSLSGPFYAVLNGGAVTTSINLNSNIIGTTGSGAITFNAANSSAQLYVYNSAGGSNAALSISNNIFNSITHTVAGTGANTLISNISATRSQAINGNTFNNLTLNTTNTIIFIANSVIVSPTGTQNVNNNAISGTFTKLGAAGSVTLFSSLAASLSGSQIFNNNNNFSNITVSGASTILGWINTDAGASSKYIQNNIFRNWKGGTGPITALSVSVTGANGTSDNIVDSISSAGAITGILTGTNTFGNDSIYSNTISTLSTTGAGPVNGISIATGVTKNVYKNKIYNLQASNAAGVVNGILVPAATATTITIFNNLIGDLRSPIANSTTDVVRGINLLSTTANSTINVYFNTLYLSAGSTGANFSTTGIYHTSNATATTASLTLRNNSISNNSTQKGTGGLIVAFRRLNSNIANYAATSNNNLFYAGVPSINKLIYYDGTGSDLTIANFKTRMVNKDQSSVTENLASKFLSTVGSSAVFLHMDNTQPTIVESGAVNIPNLTDDFDGQTRAGNPGYSGSSTLPDIGADEVLGIEVVPPTISYTPLTDTTGIGNRNVTGVTITDASGINITAGTKPRIYYKRFSDANVWLDNTSTTNGWKFTEATNAVSPFTFTIDYSRLYGGAAVTAGVIQYFIVAQDLSTVANVGVNSGTFSTTPVSVALMASRFPISGIINSFNISFAGTYNVGVDEVFTSLTKADGLFASINSAGLNGNLTFNITSDLTEDGTNALNQWSESGTGNYTLTIQPDVATPRTISGNVAGGLIRLNGADRVIFDGSKDGSGVYLSFKNTNTAGTTGTAFTFINGATKNIIRYCEAAAYTNAANAVILFSSSVAGGNSNNLIDNCVINATVGPNTGNVAINSIGTVGNENTSDTISNNTIIDYRERGLDIQATGSTEWTISGNSFYNGGTSGTPYPASSNLYGIRVTGGSGYTILNNYIGGNDAGATGSNAVYTSTLGNLFYQGILLSTTSAIPASAIKGNTIASITISSIPTAINANTFVGISTAGSGISIGGVTLPEGNTIGSSAINGSIAITTSTTSASFNTSIAGINCISSGGIISNNQVGGFNISNIGTSPAASAFHGIFVNNVNAPAQVNNNIIGSASTTNSISVLSTSTSTTTSLTGITIGSEVDLGMEINANRIDNISNLSTASSGSFTGINNAATLGNAQITIHSDTIQGIRSAANANAGSTVYAGIVSGSAATISNNLINNLTLSSTGINAQIVGMNISGAYATTVSSNVISSLTTSSRKTTTNAETGNPGESAIIGMINSTSASGQIINNNTFALITATSTAAINVAITGLAITSSGSGNIFSNRFDRFTNTSTGTSPVIRHLMAFNGVFNFYNNTLRISNLLNTNAVKIYGITHASATNWNYFHNTVRVGGSATGTAFRSVSFLLSGNSAPVLKNNIFFNIRTGAGTHYAVSNLGTPPENWPANASDYNDFYSINSNTVTEWGNNISKTFAQWQTLTGGDAHSISNAISFISSTDDLEPDSISNCNFNNAGTPITTPVLINTDIFNNPRNALSPDLGAYEFHYVGFSIIAGSDSPVCAGDSLSLIVDPGVAIAPRYTWRNPADSIISTNQNPIVVLRAGQYKVTVSDSTGCSVTDSTLVAINQRPTARITSASSVCDSAMVNLVISVTGTGTITGTLSNGYDFTGTAPTITIPVSILTSTSFSITDLADSSCTSMPEDIADTVTVVVTHKGDWLGITSTWNDPVNWCEGIVPTSSTNVTIPVGTLVMPIITDSAACKNLFISTGDTLTISSTGTLKIAGLLTNSGVYNDNGTTMFNAGSGQQTFSGVTTFNNLTLNNTGGLLLPAGIIIKNNLTLSSGILNSSNFNISVAGNWTNNVSITAYTAGTATVTFNGSLARVMGGTFATTFNNLTIAKGISSLTLNVNSSIIGNLSVSSGTFDLAGFTANRATSGGILSVSNSATLKIGGTNTYPANFTTSTLQAASTVEYSGTNQAVANQLYGNLTLSSSAGAAVKTFPVTTLVVAGNLTSAVGSGTSVTFSLASNTSVTGNVLIGVSTTFNGGSYPLTIVGNWTNDGIFNGNSGTVILAGNGSTVSGSGIQNYNNLTITGTSIIFSAISINLTGNLTATGSGSFTQAPGGTFRMTGTATTITGLAISIYNLDITGTVSSTSSFNVTGNLSVSGGLSTSSGTIIMSGSSKSISGSGTIALYSLQASGSIITGINFSIASGLIVSGSLVASAGTATFTGSSLLSGTANLFNVTVNGTSLQLSSGSVLGIANNLTIMSGTLDVTTSYPNTVNFNGPGAQNVNAITYSTLVLSNGGAKTAVGSITTIHDINIATGTTFNASSYTYSIYGNWINNGTFSAGTSTVEFLGPVTAYLTGATTFNILTSNTGNSTTVLIVQNNITAAIVNMVEGIITTGSNTLTITGTRTGNGYIYGNIQRTHLFTTGVAYAFEGPDNTITFSGVTGVSTITVSVVEAAVVDFPFGGSISRTYTITVPAGTYTATLRLHYEDDELNGNDESTMGLWRYNGSIWGTVGKTANSTSDNYVEQSGLTNITNRWTCSDDNNLVQWNGSVSSDWNTAANWTLLQGAGSRPPSSTDIVDLGTAAFINQPTISTGVTVKNIIFGSVQAVTLTLGSGGTLTTLGNINGTWTGNATHAINVNSQTLAVNGNLDLGDGTIGHAIDLSIGSGNVTILGSLSETGGANINFTGGGTLDIHADFEYSSGTFTAGSGTVTYDGDENQQMAHVAYNNLIIDKAAGIAISDSATTISGNLLLSAGQLDNFSTLTIDGNVTIDAGSIFNNIQILHVKGNWNNNGSYIASDVANIYFEGSGTQTISASTFNNLHIVKPVGSEAVLTGNVIIKGDLSMISGTFNIKTFDCNRNTLGGTIILADSATLINASSVALLNFAGGTVADSSTIIADGIGPQFLFGDKVGNVICRNTGPKILVSSIKINGTFTIESGASFDGGANTMTMNGNWVNNGTFVPSTSTVVAAGSAKVFSGNTTFNQMIVTGSYTFLNNNTFNTLLNITKTGSLSGGPTIQTLLHGDLINAGVLYTLGSTTFSGNVQQTLSLQNAIQTVALTVNFNGSVSPILNSTSAPQYGYLNINNTGGISPSLGWNILYSLTVGAGASFNGGNSTHNLLGTLTNNGTITSSGVLNFIPASAAMLNFGTNFSSTGTVMLGGAGAITLAGSPASMHDVVIANTNTAGVSPSSNWLVTKNFTLNSDAIFNAGSYIYSIGGNIRNLGVLNRQTSTFHLNGSAAQDIFSSSPSPFNNVTIHNSANPVTVSTNIAVYGVLNFISGKLQTGSNTVSISSTGSITGAGASTGWVNGNLTKNVAIGTNIVRAFEVGDSINYTPVSIILANVTASGDLSNKVTPYDHPKIASSEFDISKTVNRYFTISNTGTAYSAASITFNWVPTDVDPGAITTAFKVENYNGSNWTLLNDSLALPTSIKAIGVLAFGDFAIGQIAMAVWTGLSGTDWFTAGNWSASVPLPLTNATIPGSVSNYPILNAGTGTVQNITIQPGATLTVSGAVLQISGIISNAGKFIVSNGTIELNGSTSQTVANNTFTSDTIKNLTVANSAGVILEDTLLLKGILLVKNGQLNTNGHLTLISTAAQTALIDGSGTGEIVGKVTMQRYLSSGFGYKYLSSPFQAARVSELADDLNLGAAFPSVYRYEEDQLSSGWVRYTDSLASLDPGKGYAANFGAGTAPKTFTIAGAVNNHGIATPVLYNHNRPYTLGFNLIGNPYPSPIDWDVASGWSRNNIDEAIYYFNNADSSQYVGTYSTYINGISSDGVASNVIAAMQGFFVHVSNGAYPVAGNLAINNNARINNLAPNFHRQMLPTEPLLRISAAFADDNSASDPVVVYFKNTATRAFDRDKDALKLMNTDTNVPNLYAVASDAAKVSIGAWPLKDSVETIPLGLQIKKGGWISFHAMDIERIPNNRHVYLYDDKTNTYQDLRQNPLYRLYLEPGNYENRFSIVCRLGEQQTDMDSVENGETINIYTSGGQLFVNSTLPAGEKINLVVANMLGQVILKQQLSGSGSHAVSADFISGLYVISLTSNKKVYTKKVFIGK